METLFPILGACFGSFSTVLCDRFPVGRSRCPTCKHTLSPRELIPLISFLLQGGRCRSCSKPISWTYPATELISALLFWYAYDSVSSARYLISTASTGSPYILFTALLLALSLWLLFTIAIIDSKTHTISDALNIPLLILAFAFNKFSGTFDISGAALGATFFATLWGISRGRWIGSGDIILAASIGLLLGSWKHMVACLFLTYVSGALIACGLLLSKKVSRKDYIAFAPFLALGTLLTLVLRERIDLLFEVYL